MAFFPPDVPFIAGQKQIVTTFSFTPTIITTVTMSAQTVTVAGLDPVAHQFVHVGQLAQVTSTGVPAQTTGIIVVAAAVTAANTLTVYFYNTDGSSQTPTAGFYTLIVH